ncbi:SpoIID/LytB domain-containing protein [Cohnella fermenti]|uniref:SpoIID/LytB domain-containing protein n=1 Tax=Cohnella fermenti TaxID=2565925 RepID=A0A4S4CCX9_9BACL|nr:SpoIID/LytB domain-containing protein [Cohnella fermenti]THF83822.1 SpoIID/LytB domain-containing protein [Cohnella fermenti]
MTYRIRNSYGRTALLGTLLAAVTLGSTGAVATAITVPDTIRVALFLDLGSRYQLTTPVATLASDTGLQLALGGAVFGKAAGGQQVRFTVDGYKAKVLETNDLTTAITVLKKIQTGSNAAYVTMLSKNGKAVYQVTEGNYATAAAATSALAKWNTPTYTLGATTLTPAAVVGPLAVEAGPYASEAAASDALTKLGGAGLDAFLAYKSASGKAAYYVRIGQAADATALSAIQLKAGAAGITAKNADATGSYAILRNDMTVNGAQNKPVNLYAVGSGAALTASPAGSAGIQVVERSKQTYRGSIELSALNNNLAVVNEVDLEQYLYSVVGSEIYSSWPAEAQKAQAVAARTYSLSLGVGFQIANVVDTTLSQMYTGMGGESKQAIAAVQATEGEVMTYGGKPISAVFSANSGGVTADNATEVWRNVTNYLVGGIPSPDEGPQEGLLNWNRVVLESGKTGYIRSDLLRESGTMNEAGIKLFEVTGDGVAVRSSPQVVSSVEPIARANKGDKVVTLEVVPEYTAYSWREAPVTPDELLTAINKRAKTKIDGPLRTLEVSQTGPSGRAIEIKVNGQAVDVGYPDNLRGALGGIKSTLFTIEETGRIALVQSNGQTQEKTSTSGFQVIGAGGTGTLSGNYVILGADGALRAATTEPGFVISGKGYGHGLGMSQWGAKGLADQGYDYQSILLYYYKDVKIEKDGRQ